MESRRKMNFSAPGNHIPRVCRLALFCKPELPSYAVNPSNVEQNHFPLDSSIEYALNPILHEEVRMTFQFRTLLCKIRRPFSLAKYFAPLLPSHNQVETRNQQNLHNLPTVNRFAVNHLQFLANYLIQRFFKEHRNLAQKILSDHYKKSSKMLPLQN